MGKRPQLYDIIYFFFPSFWLCSMLEQRHAEIAHIDVCLCPWRHDNNDQEVAKIQAQKSPNNDHGRHYD